MAQQTTPSEHTEYSEGAHITYCSRCEDWADVEVKQTLCIDCDDEMIEKRESWEYLCCGHTEKWIEKL